MEAETVEIRQRLITLQTIAPQKFGYLRNNWRAAKTGLDNTDTTFAQVDDIHANIAWGRCCLTKQSPARRGRLFGKTSAARRLTVPRWVRATRPSWWGRPAGRRPWAPGVIGTRRCSWRPQPSRSSDRCARGSAYKHHYRLPGWKDEFPVFSDVNSKALQRTITRFYQNLDGLSEQKQNGNKVGKLTWKSPREFQSMTCSQSGFELKNTSGRNATLWLSKIGDITIRYLREIPNEASIKEVTVAADPIAMRWVRDHLQELDLIGIVEGRTKTSGIQGGTHYVWELDADIEMTVDVLREVDRLGDAMAHIT